MESDFQACVMAAAQVAAAIASNSGSEERALRMFNDVLDAAMERMPDYDEDEGEEE